MYKLPLRFRTWGGSLVADSFVVATKELARWRLPFATSFVPVQCDGGWPPVRPKGLPQGGSAASCGGCAAMNPLRSTKRRAGGDLLPL